MPLSTLLTLGAAFVAVAIVAGLATAAVLTAQSAERQRLHAVTRRAGAMPLPEVLSLTSDRKSGGWGKATEKLGSKKQMGRLQGRLNRAGFTHPVWPFIFTFAEYALPVAAAMVPLTQLEAGPTAWLSAAGLAIAMHFAPGFFIDYRLGLHRRDIQNGLPDALDLLVVCIEAGCGLDQAIVKVGDELAIAYPVLANEFRILNSELRAGKPRMEAFKSLAARTRVDDVRALVAMLVQTDKFGTSIGQALRTHADTARDKRRQRAEERAQKIAVKLVFPLVLCFFPALYVVILGPAVIVFKNTFMH